VVTLSIRDKLRLIGIIGTNINPNAFEHVQTLESDTWSIQHNLNTGVLQVWCYDPDGNRFEPSFTVVDNNNIEIYVHPAIAGIAYIFPLDILQG
jgi:hypothetical protein